jgi:hypothetical protein
MTQPASIHIRLNGSYSDVSYDVTGGFKNKNIADKEYFFPFFLNIRKPVK